MAWVVDTSILLDVRMIDDAFGMASARCLAAHLEEGLVISPVTYVELAPAFGGDSRLQENFLERNGVEWLHPWIQADTEAAHRLWADYVKKKRAGEGSKGPVADVFIEAFARRFQGLITRNPSHFTTVQVVVP
jgi:predicted nucleic acid-binding protein